MNTGGPAFPGVQYISINGKQNPEGMTLLDYFASKILPSVYKDYCEVARLEGWTEGWRSELAKEAYKMANEMLKARQHEKT